MRNRALYTYVWATCLGAVVLASGLDWGSLADLSVRQWGGLATLTLLGIVADARPVSIKVGQNVGGSSIAFLPFLSILLLFGPAATVLAMFLSGLTVEYLVRHKEPIRANFNIAQYAASTSLAGYAFMATHGEALVRLPPEGSVISQVLPFFLFAVVFLVLNNTFVAGAISLSQGLNFGDVWRKVLGPRGTHVWADLLIGPIAIAVAVLYDQIGFWGIVLAITPLIFIRNSYLVTQQLQQVNEDLLRALVKAIETRDPYTSGHSLRVSQLARRIAEQLNLSAREVGKIETAALLHDVGKIEATYTGILAKPDALTAEERAVIESHVTKGEELLRKLSSVPEDVILSVRHHHERVDGTGYPDGLSGEQIPLGARIIGVCDAVDAMLSDRPYRRALPLHVVAEQLRLYSNSQFDATVIQAVLAADLIGEYADIMRVSHSEDWAEKSLFPGERAVRANTGSESPSKPAISRVRRHLRSLPS